MLLVGLLTAFAFCQKTNNLTEGVGCHPKPEPKAAFA
jgi:hypothetical protein